MEYVFAAPCLDRNAICIYACPVDCIHIRAVTSRFEISANRAAYVQPGECAACDDCIIACNAQPFSVRLEAA